MPPPDAAVEGDTSPNPQEVGRVALQRIRGLVQTEAAPADDTVALHAGTVSRAVMDVIAQEEDHQKKQHLTFLAYERERAAKNFPAAITFLHQARLIEDSPQLAIEEGKLRFLVGDAVKAYQIFRELAENHQTFSGAEQAHEVLWFLFKTLRVREISAETYELFQENLRLMLKIQERFNTSYNDILRVTELALAFRRGYDATGDNEGSAESGYDETIRLGEALQSFGNPRVEADRQRLIGASYLKKAEERREFFLKAKSYCSDEGASKLRKEQLQLLERGEMSTKRAVELLESLPDFESEGGELLRTRYNLAKILCLKTAASPGNPRMFSDASMAIGQLQTLSEQAKNPLMIGMAYILYGELLRFGWHDPAGEDELRMALASNQKALEAGSGNTELLLSVLINIGEILLALEGPDQARPYIEEAAKLFFERADLRIVRWAEESLRNLAKKVDVVVQRPKASLFAAS